MRVMIPSFQETYKIARYVAHILAPMPLVGKTEQFVKNSKEVVNSLKGERVEVDQELRSYDVMALFTSILVDKALDVIKKCLEKDSMLKERAPPDVVNLLELCLRCTYCVFQGEFYQ